MVSSQCLLRYSVHSYTVYVHLLQYFRHIKTRRAVTFVAGFVDLSDGTETKDGKPFLQLNYANGPSYPDHRMINGTEEVPRKNLTGEDVSKYVRE